MYDIHNQIKTGVFTYMKSIIANNEITAKSVRLVTGDSSDVVAISIARQKAFDEGLDLVQVNDSQVPVVKIVDLNKYKYELKQAEKASQKKQRQNVVAVKEIQFAFGTQDNDLNVKAKAASKFLDEGKHVRIVMKTVGRGPTNPDLVQKNLEVMNKFVARFSDIEFVQKIEHQGRNVTCILKQK